MGIFLQSDDGAITNGETLINKKALEVQLVMLQHRYVTNPKQNTKLLCSDRNSLQPAGVKFIFSASSFGLVYNHVKLGILNYHKDLVLQWLKGSKAQFRRRSFHEPNLIQIKAGPNHENPAF